MYMQRIELRADYFQALQDEVAVYMATRQLGEGLQEQAMGAVAVLPLAEPDEVFIRDLDKGRLPERVEEGNIHRLIVMKNVAQLAAIRLENVQRSRREVAARHVGILLVYDEEVDMNPIQERAAATVKTRNDQSAA